MGAERRGARATDGLLMMNRLPRGPSVRRADPTLTLNPSDDQAFTAAAHAVASSGAASPELLQAGLRATWPKAVVRRRDLAGEVITIWYVYRDGHWVPSRKSRKERTRS